MKRGVPVLRLFASVSLIGLSVGSAALANGGGSTATIPGADLPPEFIFEASGEVETGVSTESSPTAVAIVASVPQGTFVQHLAVGGEGGDGHQPADVPVTDLYLENAGALAIRAEAIAIPNASPAIQAQAAVDDAISQIINGPNQDLSATFVNSGDLEVSALADASAGAGAEVASLADASVIGGIHQEATVEGGGDGLATVSGLNSGTYRAFAVAAAASQDDAEASAVVEEAIFARAQANGAGDGTASASFENTGDIQLYATSGAVSAAGTASSLAAIGGGEHGMIHIRAATNGVGLDEASTAFINRQDATLEGVATASAIGLALAEAQAIADGAMVMKAQASGQDYADITMLLANQGAISFSASSSAQAMGADGDAAALTSMSSAISQTAEEGGPASFVGRSGVASIENGGMLTIAGQSQAVAQGNALATTLLQAAILQEAENMGFAGTSFLNDGGVLVSGQASASGAAAQAQAAGTGLEQEIFGLGAGGGGLAAFGNYGTFSVAMAADATATDDDARAEAGASGFKVWGEPINLAIVNSGDFTVTANALSSGQATAEATGLALLANWDPTVVLPEDEEGHGHGGDSGDHGQGQGGPGGHGGEDEEGPPVWEEDATNAIRGFVSNSGTIRVSASAEGVDAGALATGIYLEAAVLDLSILNSGLILAEAATNGGASMAYGVRAVDFAASPLEPGVNDRLSFINDGGSIVARTSGDLGASWAHGLAIDSSFAPNPVDIRFRGASYVYGDVDLSADDSFAIDTGILTFDGVINPDEQLEGQLTIASGAALYLTDTINTNPDYDGPAGAWAEDLTIADGGILALQLPVSATGNTRVSSSLKPAALTPAAVQPLPYPQIFTDTASLGGTLVLVPSSPNGLYDDAYFWDNVIDANTLMGAFGSVVTSTRSLFLAPEAFYDDADNVDLGLTRIAFGDARFALTPNQRAAAEGIEGVYSSAMTGGFADMVADLFLMDDVGEYSTALSALHGAQYATYVQSLGRMGQRLAGTFAEVADCDAHRLQGGRMSCRRDNKVGIWATANWNDETISSDSLADATGYASDQFHFAAGADLAIGGAGVIGIGGGYLENKGVTDWFGGSIDSDGWHIGAYGAYDPGDAYLKAAVTHARLNGTSAREIVVASSTGDALADLDARIWAISGEFGYRFPLFGGTLTPYAGLDWVSVALDGFAESGTSPGRLAVAPSSNDFLTSELGLKAEVPLGPVTPQARVGWRHEFNGSPTGFDASYAQQPGSVFSVVGPHIGPDSLLVDASLSAQATPWLRGRFGYQGRFGQGVKDNALYGSLLMKFGAMPSSGEVSGAALADPILKMDLQLTGLYDDNIYGTRNDKISDYILQIRPSARLQLGDRETWLEFGGRGNIARNADYSSENYADWTIDWDSRLRIGAGLSAILNGDYAWTHEARTSPEAVFGLEPTRYSRGRGTAGLLYRGQDWYARLAVSGTSHDFQDTATLVGSINNDDRDRTKAEVAGRLGYKISGSADLFVQAALDQVRYEAKLDDFGYARDADGANAVLGLKLGGGGAWSGEIFAGYLQRSFDDARLQELETFDLGLLVNWEGRNADASLRVDRDVGETTFPGASGYVLTDSSIAFSAAAGPRLAAGITLRGTLYDYVGIDRQEFDFNTDVWTRYWFSRHFYAGLGYSFTQRISDVAGYNYEQNRVLLTLGSQLRPRYMDNARAALVSGPEALSGAYAAVLVGHGTLATGVDGPRTLHDFNIADFGNDGAAFGGAIGYGLTFNPIYLGLELTAMVDGPDWHHAGGRSFGVARDDGFELSARAGFVAAGGSLIYGRFGIASAHFSTDYETTTETIGLSERKAGLGLGFGVEAQTGGNTFLRSEYVVNSYRDYDVQTASDGRDNFSNAEGQFRFGFGIRFGAKTAPEAKKADFSGAYAGLLIGHSALTTRTAGERSGSTSYEATRSGFGGTVGAFAGYGMMGGGFYLGAELEANLSNSQWNNAGESGGRNFSARRQHSFGIGARVGRQIGSSALLYGRIGAVRTRFDVDYEFGTDAVSTSDSMTGLELGAGLEVALGDKLRLRAEYVVDDYGTYEVNYLSGMEEFSHSDSVFKTSIVFGF